jgi:hypothetical protein
MRIGALEMYIVVITVGINLQRGSVEGIVVVEARALLTYNRCVDNQNCPIKLFGHKHISLINQVCTSLILFDRYCFSQVIGMTAKQMKTDG